MSGIEGKVQTRQVFDLPIITVNVTEYRTHKVVCPKCNKVHKTEFPKTVSQPVQIWLFKAAGLSQNVIAKMNNMPLSAIDTQKLSHLHAM